MWPRIVEAVLGAWLIVSSFVFTRPEAIDVTVVPLVAGVLVLVSASFATKMRLAHLFVLVVAVGLITWGWAGFPRPGPAAAQNAILVGLTLGLVGIIPNEASRPPPAWRPHLDSGD